MARRKNAPDAIRIKNGLSERLRQLRTEIYGERGGPDQARTLGIPVRTWYNYENGVTVPAEIILRVVELTAVEPIWLLRGEGPKFRAGSSHAGAGAECLSRSPVKDLLRVALERLEEDARTSADFSFGAPILTLKEESGSVATPIDLFPVQSDRRFDQATATVEGQPLDPWHPARSVGRKTPRTLRVDDDAMAPIVAQGAHVTYGDPEPVSESLNDKLVVAQVEGKHIVRWFQHCGKFGLLKTENPLASPPSILVELEDNSVVRTFHRVLWISTPH